jgi:hypothetical protein
VRKVEDTPSVGQLYQEIFDRKSFWGLVLTALVMSVISFFLVSSSLEYQTRGIKTEGQVTQVMRSQLQMDRGRGGGRTALVRHTLPDGETVVAQVHDAENPYVQRLEFHYLPESPTRGRAQIGFFFGYSWLEQAILLLVIPVVCSIFIYLFSTKKKARMLHQLIKDGEGMKVKVAKIQTDDRRKDHAQLLWEAEDGSWGRTERHPKFDFKKINEGDEITIYRLNGQTWWEGDLGMIRFI